MKTQRILTMLIFINLCTLSAFAEPTPPMPPPPHLISPLTQTRCNNVLTTYTAIVDQANVSVSWTRAAVPFISNPASSGNSAVASEALVNTSTTDKVVVYVFRMIRLGMSYYENVTITVRPNVIVNAGPNVNVGSCCLGVIGVAGANPNYTYQWIPTLHLNQPTASQTKVSTPGNSPILYTLTATYQGCSASDQVLVGYNFNTCCARIEDAKDDVSIISSSIEINIASLNVDKKIRSVSMYDLTGKMVYNEIPTSDPVSIEVSNLSSGMYVVNVLFEDNSVVKRKVELH